jgi:hypothetical protein
MGERRRLEIADGLYHVTARGNATYAQRFKARHRRVGHVFQGPYGAELVTRDGHLLELSFEFTHALFDGSTGLKQFVAAGR